MELVKEQCLFINDGQRVVRKAPLPTCFLDISRWQIQIYRHPLQRDKGRALLNATVEEIVVSPPRVEGSIPPVYVEEIPLDT
jgi:hypothetical protein